MRIIHELPGRLRIQFFGSEVRRYLPASIEVISRSVPAIYSANYSPVTQRLLVYYEPQLAKTSEIMQALGERLDITRRLLYRRIRVGAATLAAAIVMDHYRFRLPWRWQWPLLISNLVANVYLNPAVFRRGTAQLLKGQPSADSLTMTSILAAFLTKQPITATLVMIMSSISDGIEAMTDAQSHVYLENSLKTVGQKVHLVAANGQIKDVALSKIKPGDILHFYTGEKIVVDGTVTDGTASIDEAGITGEFELARKTVGADVYASTVVEQGQLEVRSTKLGTQTEEAAIYRLLQEAAHNKSELQKTADKLAQRMVPISFFAAGMTYLLTRNIMTAVGVLVVDFVCGVKLSSEIAILTTLNHYNRRGVVIKGGRSIENAARIKEVIFDKTGTLTTGKPTVQQVLTAPGIEAKDLLAAVGYGEQHVVHPLSRAIMAAVREHSIPVAPLAIEDEEVLTGYGILAHQYHGQTIAIGSDKLMAQVGADDFSAIYQPRSIQERAIYVAADDQPLGVIILNDGIRRRMAQTIDELRQLGVEKITMLTGDKAPVARAVARELHIDNVQSGLLPQDKVAYVQKAQSQASVMMVGDGLNDAAALKWSDVGVTLGSQASGAAKNACDILIQGDHPEIISEIMASSQQTMRIIKQNYRVVFAVNTTAIGLNISGKIHPIMSAVIHNGTTIGVILRSIFQLR